MNLIHIHSGLLFVCTCVCALDCAVNISLRHNWSLLFTPFLLSFPFSSIHSLRFSILSCQCLRAKFDPILSSHTQSHYLHLPTVTSSSNYCIKSEKRKPIIHFRIRHLSEFFFSLKKREKLHFYWMHYNNTRKIRKCSLAYSLVFVLFFLCTMCLGTIFAFSLQLY